MGRLSPVDTQQDIVVKLSAGNPGAMRVLFELMKCHEDGKLHMLKFDDYGIYGSCIWLCWKDLLNYDTAKLFELLKQNKLEEAILEKSRTDANFKKVWEYHKRQENLPASGK